MKIIKITKGYETIVDDEDFDMLSKHNWFACLDKCGHVSVRANNRGELLYMSRILVGVRDKTLCVDHINRNPLDNRKQNLRICTKKQNNWNTKLSKKNTSGYRGVNFYKQTNRWVAKISINNVKKSIGYFDTPEEAAKAYDAVAKEIRGEFAVTNF